MQLIHSYRVSQEADFGRMMHSPRASMDEFLSSEFGMRPGINDSWPKAALQVNGVPRSSHKKFATFFEALDSFPAYCTFKSETVILRSQAEAITDEEVDREADEFTKFWLAPLPTDLPMP